MGKSISGLVELAQYSGALTLQLKFLHTPKLDVAVLHVLYMLNQDTRFRSGNPAMK
jgi:hypothetical protein